MANIKITGLNELTDPTLNDVFPIVNGGDTKKVQLGNTKEILGINKLDNVTKYLPATYTYLANMKVNITNTLTPGMILYIQVPAGLTDDDAKLSIDNGSTYENIKIKGVNATGWQILGNYITLRYSNGAWQTENLNTRLTVAETSIGTLANLTTTEKTNLVGAINEVEARVDTIETGWLPAGETWTYSSVDDPTGNITISGDVTSKYSLGMRIKFTNGGNTIYGIITKIAYSSPNTILTFLHEINTATGNTALHLMANSAITNNYYSNMKVPYGFPLETTKWTIEVLNNGTNEGIANPVTGTWYNIGNYSLKIPIGDWRVFYKTCVYATRATSSYLKQTTTLSTANNTESDKYLSSTVFTIASDIMSNNSAEKNISVTSPTNYYLNHKSDYDGTTGINIISSPGTYIRAICAYL